MPLHRIDPAVDQFVKHNPVVATFASALEQAVAEIVDQCYVDSKATVETLGQAVADLSNSLEKSRKVLAGSFARVRHKKVAGIAERVDRLQAELNAQRSWLLETIRPQFEQPLKSLEPAGKPVLGVLERITESARQAVDTLSDEQEPPEPAPDPGEKHLLQRLNKQIIDITGMGKPPHLTLRKRASQALPTIESLQQNPMVTEHAELVARLGAKTGDLWTSLRFHLQIAGEELDLLKAEPLADRVPDFDTMLSEAEQLSLGVINSVAEQIAAQILPLQSFWGDFGERLQEYQVGFCQSLYQAVVSRESGNAGVWDNLSRSFRHHRDALQQRILSHKDPHAPANFLSLGKAALAAWQESFHQEPGDQEKRLGLTDLPSNDEILKRADAFPLLYRRLFTLGPLKNHEFLVARDEELKILEDLFKRWKDGKPCSLAVIGPEGSGKTSLVNCFAGAYGARGHLVRFEISRRLRSEQEVVDLFHQWFDIEQPTDSLDALVQQLLARPRGMVLVEGGHNLALRVVGGSRAAEVFFFLLLATRQHFLWLVTFRIIPWTRMDYQFNVSRFFTHQIPTLLASQQEIHQALMLRQRISGYPLIFPDESPEASKNTSPEEKKNREAVFFGELFTASGGNLDAAIYYWIMCLEYNPKEKSFRNLPLGKIDFSFLRSLDGEQLFTLAEVLGHGGLSADEHSKIFHCDLLRSHLQLDFLNSLGLLLADPSVSDERPNHYRLNPVYYAPVTNTLESMHILY